ncbi:MAG: hypothetical protein WCV92_00910 [Candidatus Buchananbacteria bacterium]
MIVVYLLLFLLSLLVVIKSADFAIYHSGGLARGLHISRYVVGFLLIAIISILPETFIAISSSMQGIPSFGLGALFGSNVADLTLVFAIIILFSARNIKVDSQIVKKSLTYILILAMPIVLGWNGYYSRFEGIALILSGVAFYAFLLQKSSKQEAKKTKRRFSWKHFLLLLTSMALLLVASTFTVKFAVLFADGLQISPIIVAMLFVGLGTTLPELFFSLKAVKDNHDGLALGDILGTVITDATIVVGILAIISPFAFNPRIVYVTGAFMLVAAIILLYFMKTGKKISKREGLILLFFYIVFLLTEFMVGRFFSV